MQTLDSSMGMHYFTNVCMFIINAIKGCVSGTTACVHADAMKVMTKLFLNNVRQILQIKNV